MELSSFDGGGDVEDKSVGVVVISQTFVTTKDKYFYETLYGCD